jgi:two-component system chemotaxis sensor kinase CheA
MADVGRLQAQLLGTFFEESFEQIERLEAGLLHLERAGFGKENVDDIFRAAHSLKGSAGTFGFASITEVAHALENILDRMRAGTSVPDSATTASLLDAVDSLRRTLEDLREGRPAADLGPILKRLGDSGHHPLGPAAPPPSGEGWRIAFRPAPHLLRTGNDPARLLRELERLGSIDTRVHLNELPPLRDLRPEDCYLGWTIELRGAVPRPALVEVFAWVEGECDLEITALVPPPPAAVGKAAVASAPGRTAAAEHNEPGLASVRISIDKVDLLMNMVGELVITQSMLGELDDRPLDTARVSRIREGLSQLARNSRALQESVMRLRSMPISVVFNRFPRLVHDLSRQLGKQVELRINGQNTELDKTVLEKLGDPLVHLVRNSLDHGLETPEGRRAAGKPEIGVLSMTAHHRGADIVIEVEDDGNGLDLARLLTRARERGLVAADAQLSDEEIRDLIFAPGFSTAAAVTDLSGRGVGLDVVRRNVRVLGGNVSVESQHRRGTRVTLRLPLTLAIIDGQLVRVGSHPYVIPLLAIVESVVIERSRVKRVAGAQEVYRLRDELVPMLDLASVLGLESVRDTSPDGLLVVVEAEGRQVGLVVDDIQGLQQVVVKNLEANYERVPGLSGATILGDGSVAFILDIAALGKSTRRAESMGLTAPALMAV